MKQIGLFGGSFNPVHEGHIAFAQIAKEQLHLDRVICIPAARSPFKQESEYASEELRLRLLKQAIEGKEGLQVSDIEYSLPQPSYTYQTIHELRKVYPEDIFYLLMGADVFMDFSKWRYPEQIATQANLVTIVRDDISIEALQDKASEYEAIYATKCFVLNQSITPYRSSDIRKAIALGRKPNGLIQQNLQTILQERVYMLYE